MNRVQLPEIADIAACRVLSRLIEHLPRWLVLAAGAATDIILSLVIVNCSKVLGTGDAARPLGRPGEAPALANIPLVSRGLRLRVQADLLVESVGLQRRDEALLLHANRILLHGARRAVIYAARIHYVQVLKEVANHRLPQISNSLVLHHVEGHGREDLAALAVVLGAVAAGLGLAATALDARRRAVVRADAFSHQVILIRRRHQLLVEIAWIGVLVAQLQFLIIRQVVLLAHVYHWRCHVRQLSFLIASFHSRRDVPLMLDQLEVLQLVILSVKILSSVVEYLHLVKIVNLVCLLLQLVVLDFVVETAARGACSRVRWRLPLPLHRFDDFAGLRIYLSEWVHAALVLRMQYGVPALAEAALARNPASAGCSRRWPHHLSLARMVHLRLLAQG